MFNGITMWNFNPYMVNFGPEGGSENPEQVNTTPNETLEKIESIIKDGIDETEKSKLNGVMDDTFFNQLGTYLQNNKVSESIKNSLISVLNAYQDKNDDTYKNLAKLAQKLKLKENNWEWSKETQNEIETTPQKPSLNFEWTLEWITSEWQEKKKGSEELWSELTRDAPEEGRTLDEDKNLHETIKTIQAQLAKIWALLEDSKLSDDSTLKKTQEWLKIAQTVIDYPTAHNVKILQKFISDNLWEKEKKDFDGKSYNKKRQEFDGKFWEGTLKWVNSILKKTGDYISSMENYQKALDKQENIDNLDKIKVKNNPTITKISSDTDEIDYSQILNLPEGVSPEYEISDEDKNKLKTPWSQDIALKVKIWEEERIFNNIKVTVTDSPSTQERNEQSSSSEPLTIWEWDNQKSYLVMQDSWNLANKLNLSWATIYSTVVNTPQVANCVQGGTDAGPRFSSNTLIDAGGEKSYYLKLDRFPDVIYEIKVDSKWNLCPIATEIINRKDKKGKSEVITQVITQVLFMKNPSCIKYLQNKLGSGIAGNPIIGWSERKNDYNLQSYWRSLTIEPMTIAWDWISKDLWRNLAFLNLTNYIRTEWDGRNRPDPDVNRKVDKFKWIKENWKRLTIDKYKYWLKDATNDELVKFKRYNNGEKWEDDWDKKRKNKIYKKIYASF